MFEIENAYIFTHTHDTIEYVVFVVEVFGIENSAFDEVWTINFGYGSDGGVVDLVDGVVLNEEYVANSISFLKPNE